MKKKLILVIAMATIVFTAHSQNTWMQKADFGGTAREGAVGFSIGSKGYIGTGDTASGQYTKDFWEYTPDFGVGIPFIDNDTSAFSVFPNPFESSATILVNQPLHGANLILYDQLGNAVKRINNINAQSINVERGALPSGIYFFTLMQDGQVVTSGKITAE